MPRFQPSTYLNTACRLQMVPWLSSKCSSQTFPFCVKDDHVSQASVNLQQEVIRKRMQKLICESNFFAQAEPNNSLSTLQEGYTPLHLATLTKNNALVKSLCAMYANSPMLDNGFSVSVPDVVRRNLCVPLYKPECFPGKCRRQGNLWVDSVAHSTVYLMYCLFAS